MTFSTKCAVFLCFLSYFCNLSHCLYEDQVGKFDWRQQYVGGVTWVEFDQSSSTGKQLIVATKQNVLASLNSKNGQIGWRHIFEKGNTGRIDDVVQSSGHVIATMGGGEFVRCVHLAAGSMAWEVSIPEACSSERSRLLEWNDGIAILSAGGVHVYEINSGTPLWTKQLPDSDNTKFTTLLRHEDSLLAVGIASGSHISVVSLTEDGVQISQLSVPAAWADDHTSCQMINKNTLACLDQQSATLNTLDLSKAQEFTSSTLQSLGLDSDGDLSLLPQTSSDSSSPWGILLQMGVSNAALLTIKDNAPSLQRELKGVSAAIIGRNGDETVLFTLARTPSQTVEMRGYDAVTGQEMAEYYHDIVFPAHHGFPTKMSGLILQRRDGTTAVRVMVVSQDDSLVLLHHTGRVSWHREEAISSIVSVEMVDLPVSRIQAQMEEEFGNQADDIFALFLKRFSSQFTQLQEFFIQLKHRLRGPRHQHLVHDVAETDDEENEEEDEEYMTRDSFNLHKMIVAATSTGKIFGIDSLTGQVMWRQFLPDFRPFIRYGKEMLPLMVQRTTSHFPHTPVCTVFGAHKTSGQTMQFTFNPISGAPVDGMPPTGLVLNYKVSQLMMIPQMNDDFQHPIVLLDDDLKFHVYPETDTGFVKTLASVLYMFTSESDRALLKGYRLIVDDAGELRGHPVWTVNLQAGGQSISHVVSKRTLEHVHSQGIVLGDRSVLYKYLNPNLIAVATEGIDNTQKSFFTIYLIDAVSGNMVFHCNHKRAKGPSEIVHSENWVVYTFWNQKMRRNEIAVLELYEGKKQSNATAFSSLAPPPNPITMRQAYIFSGHVNAMAATITEKGITNKHVLMALEMGGVLDLPKMLFDPRRPIHPTQEHREEGLLPYIPELPRPFESMINYNLTVNSIRGIHSSPAGLESTSLILCYGLDLFYTQVTPSKMFDVLKDDFDYAFISSVLLAMITVSVVVRKLAARKAMTKAWK